MASKLTVQAVWHDELTIIDLDDPVQGGADGVDNIPHVELAQNDRWLKTELAKALERITALENRGVTTTAPTTGTTTGTTTGSQTGTTTGTSTGTTPNPTYSMGIDLSSSYFTSPDTVNFVAYISPHGDIDTSKPMDVTMSLSYSPDTFTFTTIDSVQISWTYNAALSGTIQATGNKLEHTFVLPSDRTYHGVSLSCGVAAYLTDGQRQGFNNSSSLTV